MSLSMNRRRFLQSALAVTLVGGLRRRASAQDMPAADVLFVQVMASGGWDQLLFCDPKPGLRSSVLNANQIRTAGGIPYAVPATAAGPRIDAFFQRHHANLLVFNGVDTTTNNHEVGTRYSSTGSLNTGYPIFAAQVAAVYGRGRPMPMVDLGGYDEAGELLAPTRLGYENLGLLRRLREPRRFTGDYIDVPGLGGQNYPEALYLPDAVDAVVARASAARLDRQRMRLHLPQQRAALEALSSGREGARQLGALELPDNLQSDTRSLIDVGIRAFKRGLAVAINCDTGGFDTHGGGGGDEAQSAAVGTIFDLCTAIVDLADAQAVPVAVVLCSDFGRTPYADGGGGTDHWPVSTLMVLHNGLGAARTNLPVDRVIGFTTDGDAQTALRAVKIDPLTFEPDDQGIVVSPGHVYRALRRVARIDGHPALARFPITLESDDLALG